MKAEILQLPGISGHADNNGLMKWISALKEKPQRVFVTHGDALACETMRDRIAAELGMDTYAPYSGTSVDLATGEILYEAPPRPILHEGEDASDAMNRLLKTKEFNLRKETAEEEEETGRKPKKSRGTKGTSAKAAGLYLLLWQAGERLLGVIRRNEGIANSDLKKFTRQLNELCDRWDR